MKVLKFRDACHFCEECLRNHECIRCFICNDINGLLEEIKEYKQDIKILKEFIKKLRGFE